MSNFGIIGILQRLALCPHHFVCFLFCFFFIVHIRDIKKQPNLFSTGVYPGGHISHNTPCLLPKTLHKHCLQFLLGITVIPRRNFKKRANKVYCGRCANCECPCKRKKYNATRLRSGYPFCLHFSLLGL